MLSSWAMNNGKILVKTGYADGIVAKCREWAGKYDKAKGGWLLPATRLDDVIAFLGDNQDDQVEIEVGADDWHEDGSCIRLGWYVLASRRGRDDLANVMAELIAGTIPKWGGSTKYPTVSPSKDARFTLWVPRAFAEVNNLKITNDPALASATSPSDPDAKDKVIREYLAHKAAIAALREAHPEWIADADLQGL